MKFRPGLVFSISFSFLLAAVGAGVLHLPLPAHAKAQNSRAANATGLPLPRFVSLKSGRVNMRVGPGTDFKVEWLYLKKGLPMEIIQEYENWRRVRDSEGNEGWILHSLLAGKRTVIFKPWEKGNGSAFSDLHANPSNEAPVIAKIEPGVLGEVVACNTDWCQVRVEDIRGYALKHLFWGVYPDEQIER